MNDLSSQLHPDVTQALSAANIVYKVFECDPQFADTKAFCDQYGFSPAQAANAIIAATRTEPIKFACCIVLATTKIDINRRLCQLLEVKKAAFASAEQTLELTGMQIGGVTPFGLNNLPIFIDASVMQNEEVVMGGGNRSTKLLLNPKELLKLAQAQVVEGLAKLRD
jgi:prolyl-tRNA editing enzyme YbaK/EbsC (Cys-tRNA(Pro) deacylase)